MERLLLGRRARRMRPRLLTRARIVRDSGPKLGLLVLALCCAACGSPAEPADDPTLESVQLSATTPKLRASKWVKLWSDLPLDRSSKAHYLACEGQPFRFTLAFRNMGSAIWRDVPGRGDEVGSDVFVETSNGKQDVLSGKKRFSLRRNGNDWVRGDRKAKECTMKRGCRRTRAIYGGIDATAPTAVGIYNSRWRLRDYSKAWDTPKGFGPRAELRIRVRECAALADCGCRVECSDGQDKILPFVAADSAQCKVVAETYCLPADYVGHQLIPCPGSGGAGGSGGTPGTGGTPNAGGTSAQSPPNNEEPPEGPGIWVTDPAEGWGGSSGSSGVGGSGAGATGGQSGTGGSPWDDEDLGIGTDEVPDDPDYQPDGFDGVAEDIPAGVVPADDSGCSLVRGGDRGGLGLLLAAGLLVLVRRRQKEI